MSRTLAWLMVLVAVIATTVAASAVDIDDEMRAPAARDQQWMQQAADDIGLVELSDALEEQVDAAEAAADLRAEQADQALLASLPTTSTLFTMDEDDMAQHVYVEAAMEAEAEAEAEAEKPKLKAKKAKTAKKASRKVPTPANTDSTPTSDSLPLAAPSVPGQRDPASTLLRTPGPSAPAEDESVVSGRIAKAAHHIATLAHEETKLAYEKAVAAQQQRRWSEAVARGRQSKKFERDLPPSQPQVPHPSSNGAVSNGDRNFNTLFPAATAASDNKAPSQNSDFQHRGRGDLYVDHTQMLEAGQEAEAEARVLVEADAVSDEGAEAEAETETEEEWSAEAESEAYAEADSQDTAAAEAVAAKAAEAEEDAAAGAPVTAQEPCAAQCEGAGLWKTAACQDCIVRGMVNGWIVKSVKEQQRGYNYVHFSRNQCVKYANELSLRGTPNVGAPFAACLFQKIHESCNL